MVSTDRFRRGFWTPEFALVTVMLFSLIILIFLVLGVPTDWLVPISSTNSTLASTEVLEFRRTILTVIITAFGAWVGAGAAYFFGRENLRVASQSLLDMREPSAKEILNQLSIKDLLPKPITWKVKSDDEIESVVDKLKKEPKLWFIPVKKDDGKYTIIHEEAIWRFLDNVQISKNTLSYNDIKKKPMNEVLTYIDSNKDLKFLKDIHVSTSLEKSAADTYNQMIAEDKTLAIIIALESDQPTHYITSSDIKDSLMKKLSVI
ncbi:hypothetical protein BK007_01995 [Methanobacterium subterraneum]|uniref:CBS domain-containing protein n=1 Tax=Methanobacterium subterraneum TaxID=59277 RepID=A0A2H4VA10_9EURY|nr:hypothetical protein [Methanobacterium subterraneum]AUB54910.1 hypothetical protein BK007_01995 [Methanobacterium subterraneum]